MRPVVRGKMHVGGRWVEARSGKTRRIINPYNQEVIGEVAEGDREDAAVAIRAAREAFDSGPWPETSGAEGAALLVRLGELVEQHREELAELESLDTGKTIEESRWDMDDVAGILRYYAGLADKPSDEVIASPNPDSSSVVVREPVGVCAQIMPWNYPLLQASWKIAPALAAGCTVVNGFAQATGWPGNVGVLSNWLARQDRGRVMAVWATSYQLGSILAKTFAAFMLGVAGAVWSFWGAAGVMALVWLAFYWLERDHPEEVGLPAIAESVVDHEPSSLEPLNYGRQRGGLFEGWDRGAVLTILSMGTTYFVFKFLRYALDSWSPLAVEQMFALSKAHAGYTSTLFDWVGFLGVLLAGWASDRFFHGRRYQTVVLMTVGMVGAFSFLGLVGVHGLWLFGAGLCLSGFMLMGPDSLLSGVGAIDVGGRRGAVTAAGLVNGIGSIGPIFQEEIIGGVLARYGHQAAFQLLIGVSVLGVFGALHLAHRSRSGLSTL